MTRVAYDVVIPTIGRPSLARTLGSLASGRGEMPERVIVVDDRAGSRSARLLERPPAALSGRIRLVRGLGAGPGAARNIGIRLCTAPWVVFIDDDVVLDPGWRKALVQDLERCDDGIAGCQGRISVPVSKHRRPTDWERNAQGLERASWATADMAYRRRVLLQLGGFDPRFPRAYREDADLALRAMRAGYTLVRGDRSVTHPVRPSHFYVSVTMQRGNADDARMRLLHGPNWRGAIDAPQGVFKEHLIASGALLAAAAGSITRRRRLAATAAGFWVASTALFAWSRIKPGPRTDEEVTKMALTSVPIPPAAVIYRLAGSIKAALWPLPLSNPTAADSTSAALRADGSRYDTEVPQARVSAVFFDRDGTLVDDVPYNGDPVKVRTVSGARDALDELRTRGIAIAVVTNQSGVGRGLITREDVRKVNERIATALGRIDVWAVCPHVAGDNCDCRKPGAGLLMYAAGRLNVPLSEVVMIGDTGADVNAGLAAGARAILIPNAVTAPQEIVAAHVVAPDLASAVKSLVDGIKKEPARPNMEQVA